MCYDVEIGEDPETTDAFVWASQGTPAQVSSDLGHLMGQGERAQLTQALPSEAKPPAAVPRQTLEPCDQSTEPAGDPPGNRKDVLSVTTGLRLLRVPTDAFP